MQNKSIAKNKILWLILILAVILFIVAGVYVMYRNTSVGKETHMDGPYTSDISEPQKNANSEQSPPSASDSDKQNSTVSQGDRVMMPTGNFVSTHKPTSSSTTIESVCVTTPGATCDIQFSLNGEVKSLGSKVTGQSGSANWIWSPASLGLSQGSWAISATAQLGTATQTASDPTNLEIAR